MSNDVIKLDYGLAEDMIRVFNEGAEQLQDTMQEMQSIANTLEEGALLGRGGSAFTDCLRSRLCPSISRLTEKFHELAGDVQAAIELMRQAEEEARRRF
jgi:WXG100 family type VII secretion target